MATDLHKSAPDAGARADAEPMLSSLEQLRQRIDRLEPIGRPLQPKKPCPPPDMLGAPAKRC